jgi:hypothetical protein
MRSIFSSPSGAAQSVVVFLDNLRQGAPQGGEPLGDYDPVLGQ